MAPTPPALLRSSADLDQAMTARDRSNASLARLVGCKRQTIQKLRSGKATGCGTVLAATIEGVLGVDLGSLFKYHRDVPPLMPGDDPVHDTLLENALRSEAPR